jgi:hypothetical protein
MAWVCHEALGHNLIHRICEEVNNLTCLQNEHAYLFLKKSNTCPAVTVLAHIVFHSLCEQSAVSTALRVAATAPQCRLDPICMVA